MILQINSFHSKNTT